MALFRNFIQRRKESRAKQQQESARRVSAATDDQCCSLTSVYCSKPPAFPVDSVRMVLFSEGDRKERKIIFDSATVVPVTGHSCQASTSTSTSKRPTATATAPMTPPAVRSSKVVLSPCGRFELHKHMPDVKELGEMIFGSVSMAAKGESLKVHQMRDPKQLMIARVFFEPKASTRPTNPIISENSAVDYTSSDSDSQYSTVRSLDGLLPGESPARRSIPMDVPDHFYRLTPVGSPVRTNSLRRSGRKASLQVAVDLSDTESAATSYDLLRSVSTGMFPSTSRDSPTRGSLSRSCRWRLSQATSLSERHDSFTHWMAVGCRSRQTSECPPAEEELCFPPKKRRRQLGVAVVFSVDAGVHERNNNDVDVCSEKYRQFILTHMHLIELELLNLQAQVQRACLSRERALDVIHKAWMEFRRALCVLHDAPRLSTPVWLSLMSAQSDNLALRFCDVFGRLAVSDTKSTNFFFSTLLSAVLTHHLSWVGSVAPPTSATKRLSRTRACEMSSTRRSPLIGATTDVETLSTHPYNPFWAQYLDVSGAVGFPVRQAKVLVLGDERGVIAELLFVLSYFLRCSEVRTPDSTAAGQLNIPDSLDESLTQLTATDDDDDSETITQTPKRTLSREPVFTFDEASSAVDQPPPSRRQSISNGMLFGTWRRNREIQHQMEANLLRSRNPSDDTEHTGRMTKLRDRLTRVQSHTTMTEVSAEMGNVPTARKTSLPAPPSAEQDATDSLTSSQSTLIGSLSRKSSVALRPPPTVYGSKKQSITDSGYGGSGSVPTTVHREANRIELIIMDDDNCKPPNVSSVDSGIGDQDNNFLQVNKRPAKVVIDTNAVHRQLFDDATRDEWRTSEQCQTAKMDCLQESTSSWKCEGDLGRSMLAGVCDTHCRHFALSGLVKSAATVDVYASVVDDLRSSFGRDDDCCLTPSCSSAASTVSESAFMQPSAEAVCIVADTCDWTVKVISNNGRDLSLKDSTVRRPCESVVTLVERFRDLRDLGAAPDFLLSFIEDGLASVFTKSQALAELLAAESAADAINTDHLASVVDCDMSDVPLLKNVAAVHSPEVLSSISCM